MISSIMVIKLTSVPGCPVETNCRPMFESPHRGSSERITPPHENLPPSHRPQFRLHRARYPPQLREDLVIWNCAGRELAIAIP